MIPKIIHYCWFGGNPLPPLAEKCIASWRKFLPDYEIWQWRENCVQKQITKTEDEDCLFDKVLTFDVNMIPYTAEAYRQGKYAFVSDYARFWILHKYGGLYFDTDVEVIRSMDDIIERGAFMGFETDPDGENTPGRYAPMYVFGVNPGLGFGMEKGHQFLNNMMEFYSKMQFHVTTPGPWLKTVVAYTTEELMKVGLNNVPGIQRVDGITIYPREYFAPINVVTGRLHITKNTWTIHQYMGSWSGGKELTIKAKLKKIIPEWVLLLNNRRKRRQFRIK